jgi:hypothetical protein
MKRLLFSALMVLSLAGLADARGPYYNPYRSHYSGGYGAAFGAGGYFTPFGYQPWGYSVTPTYGGAFYQGSGGMMLPGAYLPYSYGGFVPSYGYGWGGWGGGY